MSEIVRFSNAGAATDTRVLREDGRIIIRTHQETAPILEANHQAARLYDPAHVRQSGARFRWVARIPAVVVMELNARGIMRGSAVIDERRFLAFLDDPEHRRFRTDNGRRLRNLPKRGALA